MPPASRRRIFHLAAARRTAGATGPHIDFSRSPNRLDSRILCVIERRFGYHGELWRLHGTRSGGFEKCARRSRRQRRARRLQPADQRRRTCRDSGTERLRKIDADQDHYARVLSGDPRRLLHDDSGAIALERLRVALGPRHCLERSDAGRHRRNERPRSGSLGLLQQHAHF